MDFEPTTINLPAGPVPLFPLPGVFLFPHQVLPLHIFEDRYRAMIADLLDGPGRLVIAAPVLGESAAPGVVPKVVPVAGLGEILRHEKLEDGRYMIWVLGVSRVHIQEVECQTPYRQVEVLPFIETTVPEIEAEALARELREAASARLKEPLPLPDSTPPGLLADLLMQTLQASRILVERAFVEPDIGARAQMALKEAHRHAQAEHAEPDPGEAIDLDDLIDSDLIDGDQPDGDATDGDLDDGESGSRAPRPDDS